MSYLMVVKISNIFSNLMTNLFFFTQKPQGHPQGCPPEPAGTQKAALMHARCWSNVALHRTLHKWVDFSQCLHIVQCVTLNQPKHQHRQ